MHPFTPQIPQTPQTPHIPEAQLEFLQIVEENPLKVSTFNKRILLVYQQTEKYVLTENDVEQLQHFKKRLVQKLSDLDKHPAMPIKQTSSAVSTILDKKKETCQKLLESLNHRIEAASTSSVVSTATPAPSPGFKEASLNRIKQNREKTEKIKEHIIRYIIDPRAQVNDIMHFVETAYASGPFQREYALAKDIVASGKMPALPADINTRVLCIQIAALARIDVLKKRIKAYGEEGAYKFNPACLAQIAHFANALVSFELLQSKPLRSDNYGPHVQALEVLQKLYLEGAKIIKDIGTISPVDRAKKYKFNVPSLVWHMYEDLYPIILPGSLGVYTHEAAVFAFANSLALLGVSKSERGVHGGLFQEPLVIFSHDTIHHKYILTEDDKVKAHRFLSFSRALYEAIKEMIPEDEQEFFFWCADMVLHEVDYPEYSQDYLVNQKPVLSEIFDLCWTHVLATYFKDLNLSSELEPIEEKIRNMNIFLLKYPQPVASTSEGFMQPYIDYTSDPTRKIEQVVKVGKHSRFGYDVVETMFHLTLDPEKKRQLEHKILPDLAAYTASLKTKLRESFGITDTTDRNSEAYKNYLKELNSQLYTYKTQNYRPLEAYKALKERMLEFKSRILPILNEIDKALGPIQDTHYKSVWEKGKEL